METFDPSNNNENYKLVPWLNWDEWDFVRFSLFSSSPNHVHKALHKIAGWRSRGCLPVSVEVTASIIEIQQKDSYFRVDLIDDDGLDSEEMLAMLYTMAIMRLVNGVIEKTRKQTEVSIAEAAAAIDIPRMLIDIRHEGSHRELPSLRLLRLASVKALDWLKSYYWDPQKNAIPYQRGKSANVRKEIRCKLRELAFSLKVKQSSGSSSSTKKAKDGKRHESLTGATFLKHNKLFSLMACKTQSSKYVGSHKQLKRTLKNLVRLYTFFSSDVISVLLEFLLKVNSTDIVDSPHNFQISLSLDAAQTVFDEWKPAITKFSKKEPEVLLSLLKAVLDMIEFRKAIRDDYGNKDFSLSQYDIETQRIQVLSSLFTWLLPVLKGLITPPNESQGNQTEAGCVVPEPTLIELIRKCLHVSDPEIPYLLGSVVLLCKMTGNSNLNQKLNKLSNLTISSSKHTVDNPCDVRSEDFVRQNKLILQAEEKLKLLKLHKISNARHVAAKDDDEEVEDANIWTVAKSWNPCPIGMLPRSVGSSGCLPVLDFGVESDHKVTSNSIDHEERSEFIHYDKEVNCDNIEMIDGSDCIKMVETENLDLSDLEDSNVGSITLNGLKGRFLIGGVWQKVGDEELQDIKSKVRILVNKRGTQT